MIKDSAPLMGKCLRVSRECACLNLRKAARAVTQYYDTVLRETGIRGTQFTLLVAAYMAGEISITRIAEELVMDRTTLTRNLKVLEKDGLITIRAGSDRREKWVALTKQGRAIVAKSLPLWETAQQHIVAGLGHRGFESLLLELSRVVSLARA